MARRIADRLTVTLARDRELQASRRADEADARASKLEARVRALTEELDSRTGYRRVVGDSPQWRRVLTHATLEGCFRFAKARTLYRAGRRQLPPARAGGRLWTSGCGRKARSLNRLMSRARSRPGYLMKSISR